MGDSSDNRACSPASRVATAGDRATRPLARCGSAPVTRAWLRAMEATSTSQETIAAVLRRSGPCTRQNVAALINRGTIVARLGELAQDSATIDCAMRFVFVELPAQLERRGQERDHSLLDLIERLKPVLEREQQQRRKAGA